jgi:hypothetical protein
LGRAVTGAKTDERRTPLGILAADPALIADEQYYGRDFEHAVPPAGWSHRPRPTTHPGPNHREVQFVTGHPAGAYTFHSDRHLNEVVETIEGNNGAHQFIRVA